MRTNEERTREERTKEVKTREREESTTEERTKEVRKRVNEDSEGEDSAGGPVAGWLSTTINGITSGRHSAFQRVNIDGSREELGAVSMLIKAYILNEYCSSY